MIQIISFLPIEIILDIFSRLPAKSIGRCRCVSKSWCTYLSQRRFTKIKFRQQSLILISGTGSLFTIPLTLRHTHICNEITETGKKLTFVSHPGSWDSIFAVCDGLVLLEDSLGDLFLANPLTREIRQVPALPFGPNIKNCFNKYGVGYDSVNDDYKVVIISYYRPCLAPGSDDEDEDGIDIYEKVFVNVFSIKNGAWNEVQFSPYGHGHDDSPIPGVFVNGYIHWIAQDDDNRYKIVAFDVVRETFSSTVPAPSSYKVSHRSNLVEFGGNLCVYEGDDYWIMKEYGNKDSWMVINLKADEGDITPICMLGEKQVVMMKDEDDYEDAKLVIYDLDKETLEDIVIDCNSDESEARDSLVGMSEGSHGPRFLREAFVESLVSPYYSYTS